MAKVNITVKLIITCHLALTSAISAMDNLNVNNDIHPGPTDEIDRLETAVLLNRQKINSSVVRYSSSGYIHKLSSPMVPTESTVYFDGDYFRFDKVDLAITEKLKSEEAEPHVGADYIVYSPDASVTWSSIPAVEYTVVVSVSPPQEFFTSDNHYIDLRKVGMNGFGIYDDDRAFFIDSTIRGEGRSDFTLTRDEINGYPVQVLSFTQSGQNNSLELKDTPKRISVYIDENRGPSVVRVERSTDYGNGWISKVVSNTEVTLLDGTDIWVPKKHSVMSYDNGQLQSESHCDIEILSLNEPIDPEMFSLNALGIPIGTPVSLLKDDVDPRDRYEWDGSTIAKVPFYRRASDLTSSSNPGLPYLLLGVNVMALGVILLFWQWRKRRKA
ncbi:hypothetical protein [Rubinisphaera margarita]|uniref:hypothetical protein n=1 Tax=Rubinisphaera margarita TaxID=2909586 RepID=UPI001EE8A91E|nr:hypothetical protein [Rubinisphaera margarita]MCG6157244.1 hypothetical protein [Rubinisphaera margarita]